MQRVSSPMQIQDTPKKAEVTRSQILLAAAKLFSQKGYFASTLREVAKKANMKAGSVYYHFESKEQILDEVLNTGILFIKQAFEQAIDALPPEVTFTERFSAGVRAHLSTLLKDSEHASAYIRIYGQLPPLIKRRSREMRRAYAQLWIDFLSEAQREGHIRADLNVKLVAPVILGALNRTMEWYNPKHATLDDLIDTFTKVYLGGLLLSDAAASAKTFATSHSP